MGRISPCYNQDASFIKNLPCISFSSFLDLPVPMMKKPFFPYPRKRVKVGNKYYLLKVDGDRAVGQFVVNEAKKYLGIRPMSVKLALDSDSGNIAQFIELIPIFCHLGDSPHLLLDSWNMDQFLRLLLFDIVIGNSDRKSCNIVVGTDFKILGIDEGCCFDFDFSPKIQFSHEVKRILAGFLTDEYLAKIIESFINAKDSVYSVFTQYALKQEIVELAIERIDNLAEYARRLFDGYSIL